MASRSRSWASAHLTLYILVVATALALVSPASASVGALQSDGSGGMKGSTGVPRGDEADVLRTDADIPKGLSVAEGTVDGDDVIALWHFDEGAGDIAHDAVNGHDAALTNVTGKDVGVVAARAGRRVRDGVRVTLSA